MKRAEGESGETALADLPEAESMKSGAALTAVAQGLTMLTAILLGAVVGRVLGPEGKGAFTAVRQLFIVLLEGGSLGVVRASHYFMGKRRHDLPVALGTYSLVFFSGLAAAAAGLVLLTRWGFEPILTMFSGGDLTPEVGLPLVIILAFVAGAYFLYRGLLQGLALFRDMNVPQIAVTSCQLLATGCLALMGELTVVRAVIVLIVVQALGAFLTGRSLMRLSPARPTISRKVAGEVARYGRPLWIVDVMGLLLVRTDILIVGGLFGPAELGPYSVAAALAELLWFAPQVIWVSTFRRIAEQDGNDGIELTRSISHLSIITTVIASLGLAIGCYPFIRILYGSEFLGAVPLFFILLPGYASQAALGQYAIFLLGSLGRPKLDAAVTGGSAILKLLLAFVAIRWLGLGVWGVALAATIAFLIEAFSRVIIVRSLTGRTLGELCIPPRDTTRAFLTTGRNAALEAMRAASRKISRRPPGND